MLSDSQITNLRTDEKYIQLTKTGLEHLATDLIKSNSGEFKPSVSFLTRVAYRLIKARTIRKELTVCSRDFLERFLNQELAWPRTPDSIRSVCESQSENFIWMRYDAPRVEALFNRSCALLTDAAFRNVIKSHSTITNKNECLAKLTEELQLFRAITVRSINTKGIYDKLIDLRAGEFYEKNEKEIQEKFIGASRGGTLGLLPGEIGGQNE